MAVRNETRALLARAREAGFEVKQSRGTSHYKIYDGGRMVCVVSLGGGDKRSLYNARSELNRAIAQKASVNV